MGREKQIINERKRKLKDLGKIGINPYPAKFDKKQNVEECGNAKLNSKVKTSGRVMIKRNLGRINFASLQDQFGKIQIVLQKEKTPEKQIEFFKKYVDTGDFIGVEGKIIKTQTGEKSILVEEITLLGKSLLPLPSKWHGIQEDEERYRKRYLDFLMNPETREMFVKKSLFWESVRKFLKKKGFIEVETPTIEVTTGGAEARPFKTFHNDFDLEVYMRISIGELWQKRLMAAGFEKTFEIGRAYRNEGSSPEHLQEFTNMEFYWAYANYEDGMKLVQELYRTIAKEVFGKTKFKSRGFEFDLAKDWEKIDYRKKVLKITGIDVIKSTDKEMKDKIKKLGLKIDSYNRERMIDNLWKHCRKKIAGPAFLINLPKIISPLAKEMPENPGFVERFQPIIAGVEVGNGYSELNDPIDQRERFEVQQRLLESGDEEAMMPDWEFVEMLEHGMPPTCGFGFGERLFAILMDKPLRECQTFPLMKPREKIKKKK